MNTQNVAKTILRSGHFYIADPMEFTLGMFTEIALIVPFTCKLEQDYFREGDWVITCPEILMDRHNCFWHGQGSGMNDADIPNPTKWMDAWQHRRNPTWRK
jgi:hypothetical protein